MKKAPVALQLYTLRDDMANDFAGTLCKVADLGYGGVELAGTGGMSAGDLSRLLSDLGLRVAGSHVGVEALQQDLSAALDYNEELGNRYVVCPYLGEEHRRTADDWRRMAGVFERIGAACRDRGMVFAYHNHSFEFAAYDGRTGLDLLFGSSNPDLVKSELDLYWVKHGGEDPAAYLRRLADRVVLVHLKDMSDDAERSFAEVGEGILDWPAIFAACEGADVGWYIVEQDVCRRPALESVATSLRNLRAMGLA